MKLPIVFCFDANYATYAAVASYSAHKHTKTPLKIYWLTPDTSADKAIQLKGHLHSLGMDIATVSVSEAQFSEWKEHLHISRGAYLRLLIPDTINESKVIYIDCDTLVLGDLTALYETHMHGAMVAGVVDDPKGSAMSRVPRAKTDHYINSGVLLMDLDGLRADGFLKQTVLIYERYRDDIVLLDQCIINKYAEGNKCLLDKRWNFLIFSTLTKETEFDAIISAEKPAILHFVGQVKPWQSWCNPCIANLWWKFAVDLKINDLRPVNISNGDQAMLLARVMDLNERYKEASIIKDNVIQGMIEFIRKK
jgi:lipopolysaccharide biosynthesis glycosyltransferase